MTDLKQKQTYGWLLRGTSIMAQLILLGLAGAEEHSLLNPPGFTSLEASDLYDMDL